MSLLTSRSRRRSGLETLGEPNFRLQFLAQAVSVLGNQIAPIALAFAVLDLKTSASALGLVLAARAVPNIVLLPIGGVWADRLSPHRLMIGANASQFATQGITAGLLLSGNAELWHVAALQAAGGAAAAFYLPASTALTPRTAGRGRLQQANALLSLTRSSGSIFGPLLAGVLVVAAGPAWAIAVDGATFAVGALLLSRVELVAREPVERRGLVSELAAGWHHVRSRTWVWLSIVGFMAFQTLFFTTFFVLGPLIAKESLGGARAWALIVACFGVGSLLGDVLALRYRAARPLVVANVAALLVFPAMVLLPSAGVAVIAAAAVVAGIGVALPDTLWFTALQENIPAGALSRVSSYDWMGSTILRPVGFALVGPVAALVGTRATLAGAAVLIAASRLALLAVPSIRELGSDRGLAAPRLSGRRAGSTS